MLADEAAADIRLGRNEKVHHICVCAAGIDEPDKQLTKICPFRTNFLVCVHVQANEQSQRKRASDDDQSLSFVDVSNARGPISQHSSCEDSLRLHISRKSTWTLLYSA